MNPKQFTWYLIALTLLMLLISIVVSANPMPSITVSCPADITVAVAGNQCGANVTVSAPTVTSSASVTSLSNSINGGNNASGYFPVGKTLIIWIATNSNGETSECSMYVTVTKPDLDAPVINCTYTEVSVGEAVPLPVVIGECEGYAVRLNGLDYETLTLEKDLGVVNNFTYEFFVKPTYLHEIDAENVDPYAGIVGQHYAIYPGYGEAVYGPGHSTIGISVGTNGVSVYEHGIGYIGSVLVYAAPIPTENFTHVAVSIESDGTAATCKLYVNGAEVRSVSYVPFPITHPTLGYNSIVGGGSIGGGNFGYFTGELDDIRVWNYARSSADILADMVHELSGNEPGLRGYLNLNEGSGFVANGPFGSATITAMNPWIQPSAFPKFSLTNSVTGNSTAPVFSSVGTQTITWTATDQAGNVSTCTNTVEVIPTLVITCPADIVVDAAPGTCGMYVNVPLPTITGGGTLEIIYNTFTNTLNASGNYPVGSTLVIWKVRKNNATTTYCATRVSVVDRQGPALTSCAADITQELSGCGSPVKVPIPVAQDNCSDGWGLRFDKVDDQVNVDYDLATTNIFTYEFYVRPAVPIQFLPRFDNQNFVIYSGDGSKVYGPGHSIIGVSVGTNGIRVFRQTEGVLEHILQLPVVFPADKWTHVSLVIDKTLAFANCKFYFNGTFIHSEGFPTPDQWHASLGYRPEQAGGGIGGGTLDHFGGMIDELRVWNAKRTVSQMAADRRRELTGLEPNLIAYYKFNEGAGSNVVNGSAGSYPLENMDAVSAWVSPDAISDFTIFNSFNNSISASDIYPVGSTTVNWKVTDKFGNESVCSNTVQVNNVGTVDLICTNQTIDNTTDRCDAPVTLTPPTAGSSSCEGYALNFDGVDDRSSMEKDLGVTQSFTYEMWVKPTRLTPFPGWGFGANYVIYPGLPELYGVPATPYGLTTHSSVGISVGRNGIAVYEHSYEYLPIQTKWETTTPITQWTHIAVVYESNLITIYVNGEQKHSALRKVDGRTVHANLGIPGGGGGMGGGVYGSYQGDLDEVRLWDYPRTAAEIMRDKDIELKGTEAGLKGYFNFNDGNGNTIAASRFGPAELFNMDPATDWIQPDPIKDYTLSNSITGPTVTEQIFPVGETVVTWTLTDKYGVTTTCSSTITVVDAQAPVVQCPRPFVTYLPDGSINTDVVLDQVIAIDNCGIKSITNNYNGGEDASDNFPLGTTNIEFRITDIHGNETVCPAVSVTINPTKLSIPTGISPNGDGVNDAWVLNGLEYFDRAAVKIYNRNGDLVYETDHYNNESSVFRGESNRGVASRVLPEGTYFYHLKTVPDNELKDFTGFLEISR